MKLRIAGWLCFVAGGVLFFVMGASLLDRANLWPWLGFFIMLLGMALTSVSHLLSNVRRMRELRKGSPPPPEKNSPPSWGERRDETGVK